MLDLKTMTEQSEIYLLSKLTSIIDSIAIGKYLLSKDIFCPLDSLISSSEINISNEDSVTYSQFSDDGNVYRVKDIVCPCILRSLDDLKAINLKIKMDLLLFSMAVYECNRSRTFRSNVLSNFFTKSKTVISRKSLCSLCQRFMKMIHVSVYLNQTKRQLLDFHWNKRLQILVNEKCELENAMAWLSTLGGAFSALGDTYADCAEKAGLISIKQFQLALRLGDPITICRCKIYLAMSLLQQGYYNKTKHMVRDLYQFSIGPEGSKDFRLKNMCIAVWNRLKYILSENKRTRSNLTLKSSSTTD